AWLEATDATGQEFEITFTIHAAGARRGLFTVPVSDKSDRVKAQNPACRRATTPEWRWWVGGRKLFDPEVDLPVTQASGHITTESLQPLCGEDQQLKLPYETVSAVYVMTGIAIQITPDQAISLSAEIGYMRRREANKTAIEQGVFFELVSGEGDEYYQFDIDAGLLEPSDHGYAVLQRVPKEGIWYYLVDGVERRTLFDTVWRDIAGYEVQWMGEVTHREDKLAGEPDSRCHFTRCWYETDWNPSTIEPANFTPADIVYYPPGSGHPGSAEWGKQFIDIRSFDIWDKDP
ncbi:MAG: hypothetical protein JSU86_05850, partial [Phycisphaerales bacterium]